ncbi:MAG: S8 family serine peptidase, partial [Methylocystis sp.]|nr:S8 family serine peptidase [Methylocystis sp.]
TPCVLSYTSDQISALDYIFTNSSPLGFPVASVNMSLGGGLTSTNCDASEAATKTAIDNLRGIGIITAIAAGNDGSTSQISFPGCISTAFTVGSTTKTDSVSSFSNMSSVVDVLAPGSSILSALALNNGSTSNYAFFSGTSMATPHVAGAIAALKSRYPGATATQIEQALINTGKTILDTRAGGTISKPRIRMDHAVNQGWWTWGVAGIGDFNNDGRSDVLWRRSDGLLVIWLMNGGVIQSSAVVGVAPADWLVVGVGDFNGDATSDILLRHSAGSVAIWLMNGATPGALLSSGIAGFLPTTWAVAGVGKFFGAASKADILWRNADGLVAVWRMNGATVQSSNNVSPAPLTYNIVGVGDFNGDGTSDILWRDNNGVNAIWQIANGLISAGPAISALDTSWTVAGVRDVSGDGKADILWRHSSGAVVSWLMNGGAVLSGVSVGAAPNVWNIVENGSFNGTNAGIFWRHNNGSVAIWFLNNAGGFSSGAGLGVVP